MEDDDTVLFVRGTTKNGSSPAPDDVWDDTALIKAYDKAVRLAKEEVAKRIGIGNQEPKNVRNSKTHKKCNAEHARRWMEGAPCKAVYSNDGEIYEAIISTINEKAGTCRVTFVGYGNTEIVKLSDLLKSDGWKSQVDQMRDLEEDSDSLESSQETNVGFDSVQGRRSMGERMDIESEPPKLPKHIFQSGSSFGSSYGIMPPAPPLPPQLMSKLPDNDADALSSMLMSWYISGFHTGYYHGIKQARHSEEKRKK